MSSATPQGLCGRLPPWCATTRRFRDAGRALSRDSIKVWNASGTNSERIADYESVHGKTLTLSLHAPRKAATSATQRQLICDEEPIRIVHRCGDPLCHNATIAWCASSRWRSFCERAPNEQ
jgi:hypothetical protein